jgi:hypothetical protein
MGELQDTVDALIGSAIRDADTFVKDQGLDAHDAELARLRIHLQGLGAAIGQVVHRVELLSGGSGPMNDLSHGEFERRLRDLGALGDCPACGSAGSDTLQEDPFGLAGSRLKVYVAVCPTCGHVNTFAPAVLESWEGADEGSG